MMDANESAGGRAKPKQPFLRRGTGLKRYGLAKPRAFDAEQPAEKVVPPKPWKPKKKGTKGSKPAPKQPSSTSTKSANSATKPAWNTATARDDQNSNDLTSSPGRRGAAAASSRRAEAFTVETDRMEDGQPSHHKQALPFNDDTTAWDDTPLPTVQNRSVPHSPSSSLRRSQLGPVSNPPRDSSLPRTTTPEQDWTSTQAPTYLSPDRFSRQDDATSELSFLLSQSQFEAKVQQERAELAEFEQLERIVTPVAVKDGFAQSWAAGGQASPSLRGLPSLKSPPRRLASSLSTRSPQRNTASVRRETKVLAPAPTLDDSAAWSDGTPTPEPQRYTARGGSQHGPDDGDTDDNFDNFDNDDNNDDVYAYPGVTRGQDGGLSSGQSTPIPLEPSTRTDTTMASRQQHQGEATRPQSKLMQRYFGQSQRSEAVLSERSSSNARQSPQRQPTQTPSAIVTHGETRPTIGGGAVDAKLAQLEEEIALFKRGMQPWTNLNSNTLKPSNI
eukprot:m.119234 g.119234  ORF g.119234 m.119234 type:complete len:501 (+) comp15583_c0_seq1:46-1548(+)